MQTFTIGRSASNSIVLNDEMVSRHHAEMIVMDNGQVFLRDLDSSNGTFVNGNRIKECYLNKGDIVKCATTFFKWAQYINEPVSAKPDPVPSPAPTPAPVAIQAYNLGTAFRYIFTKIFSIGDLLKTDWKMSPSILFFTLTPVILIFITCMILFLKAGTGFVQIVVYPVLMSVFIFGIPQLLTVTILSVNRETNFTRNFFISSILSFLQFLELVIIGLTVLIIYLFLGDGIDNMRGEGAFPILIYLVYTLALSAIASVLITMLALIYKYFRAIGVTNGVGIHLTILSFTINSIFQFLFIYVFIVLLLKNFNFPVPIRNF
jgi:hypothetical protein